MFRQHPTDNRESESIVTLLQSDTLVSVPESKSRLSRPKRKSSSISTLESRSSRILDLDSILRDVSLEPYWNDACVEMQSKLWSPTVTDSLASERRLLILSSSPVADESSHLIQTTKSKTSSTRRYSLDLSQASATAITDAGAAEERTVSRKIRIHPEDKRLYWRSCSAARRAYNLSIESIKDRDKLDGRSQTELRRDVRKIVQAELAERNECVPSEVIDMAVNEAWDTRSAVIRKRKRGKKCGFRFRSRKEPRQGFGIHRMPKSVPYPKILGGCHISEKIEPESHGRMSRVVVENDRWYLIVKVNVTVRKVETQDLRIVAIDPGVRCFVTTFSFTESASIGDQFAKSLFPLSLRLDRLFSKRSRCRNTCPRIYKEWKQIHYDRMRFYDKRINKLKSKIQDLTNDLHKRTAHWLTENYDVILLPTFEVKGMTKKQKRKIRSKTVRQMLMLGHYRFKMLLKWIARKKGKIVVDVNEAYTSKTDSRTGEVKQIGGAKKINGLGRDINGARGILLRALTAT